MRIILSLLIALLLNGCASTNKCNKLPQVVNDYFDIYSKRIDFNKFMSYYADNAQFRDIIYGNSFNSKVEIRNFLDWNKGEFKILNGNRILTVTKHTFEVNTAITEGIHLAMMDKGLGHGFLLSLKSLIQITRLFSKQIG